MSEWIPVTEKIPDFKGYRRIWIWNGKNVDTEWEWSYFRTFFTHWMIYEEPKPPESPKKKENHFCCTFLADCYEKNSKLRVKGVAFDFPVNYCPFCGYNADDDSDS